MLEVLLVMLTCRQSTASARILYDLRRSPLALPLLLLVSLSPPSLSLSERHVPARMA